MRSRALHRGPGLIAVLAAVCLTAAPALAQERAPAERQLLLDLAGVLGEAHALRQACHPDDPMWRARMQRMIEVEAAGEALEADLTARFNSGFAAARAAHPACDAAARAAEALAAERGRSLAERLSRSP